MEFFDFLPHWVCLQNVWFLVHGLFWSNIIYGVSYYFIPLILYVYAKKRKDVPVQVVPFLPPKLVSYIFIIFIFLCGTSHFVTSLTLFKPYYYLQLAVDVTGALFSLFSGIIILFKLPGLLKPYRILYGSLPQIEQAVALLEIHSVEDAKLELNKIIDNLKSLTERANIAKEQLDGRKE